MPIFRSRGGRDLVERSQLERGGHGARAVVLVRVRRAEDGVEVGALVADRDLEHVAAVAPSRSAARGGRSRRASRPRRRRRSRCRRTGRTARPPGAARRGTRRGRCAAARRRPAGSTAGRPPPAAGSSVGDRQLGRRVVQPGDDADRASARRRRSRRSPISTRSPSEASADSSSTTSPCCAWCSAAASSSIRRPASTSISWISGSPTTKRRASPTATATFIASRTPRRAGRDLLADHLHRLLHRERAGGRARAVVAVEPAGDRVAAEVDDVAAEAVELGDDGVEDEVEAGGQLLGAALRPELGGERLRQRREAGDVGEERRAVHAVGQLDAGRERPPPVAGDVRLGVVEGELCPRHRLGRSPDVGHRLLGSWSAACSATVSHPCRASTTRVTPGEEPARWPPV